MVVVVGSGSSARAQICALGLCVRARAWSFSSVLDVLCGHARKVVRGVSAGAHHRAAVVIQVCLFVFAGTRVYVACAFSNSYGSRSRAPPGTSQNFAPEGQCHRAKPRLTMSWARGQQHQQDGTARPVTGLNLS